MSNATGPTQPPTVLGVAPPKPGVFHQTITGAQASGNWNQALNIWATPWGFLKAAAAGNATVRQQGGQQVVSFAPANVKSPSGQAYTKQGDADVRRGHYVGDAEPHQPRSGRCLPSGCST